MKSERFGLVLDPDEKNAVIQLAEQEGGLSRAALIRRLIRKEATVKGIWPSALEDSVSEPQPIGGIGGKP